MAEAYAPAPQGADTDEYVKSLCKRQEQMEMERSQTENTWQECYDNIIPRKGDVISARTPGDKRGHELFDTTAIMANSLLAGALHSMLTNPTVKFFELIMGDPVLDEIDSVKEYLQGITDRMHLIINSSNFQTEVHEIYLDEGAIGTACMYVGEHEERYVHFSARAMKEIYVRENNLGLIDIVHRKFEWSARQIMQEFGEENVKHPELIKRYKEDNAEKLVCLHIVEPFEKKFKSCYVVKELSSLLDEKYFNEFPYLVPRWTKTSGEVYGRGPGMDMLPDIKMVNSMMETTLKGAQLAVGPPILVKDDGVIGKVRMTPFGQTIVRDLDNVKPFMANSRIDFGYQAVEDVRKRIRSGFYVDQLQLNEGPQMTATEVNQRTEEKLRLMGPVLGRQHFEFLRPLVARLFGIMQRRGLVPKAPAEIQGKNFDVRYSSFIARVQRTNEGTNLVRALQVVAPIVQALPETLDNIKGDDSFKFVMDVYGVPHKLMRQDGEKKKMRAARQQAQEQVMKEAQTAQSADVVSKAGPTVVQAMKARKG